MTLYKNSFEGGTAGVALSGSNMGGVSGDQPTIVFTGASTATFDATHPAHGSVGGRIAPASGANYYLYYTCNGAAVAARCYVYKTSAGSADLWLIRMQTGGAATQIATLKFNAAGNLRIQDSTNATIWTQTGSFPLTTLVRVDFFVNTTTGQVKAAFGTLDAAATQDSGLLSANTGSTAVGGVRIGKGSTDTYATAFWLDDIAVDDAASTYIPPGLANALPTVTVSPNQNVAASATVNLSGTANDPDGAGIASTVWTYVYPASGGPTLTGGSTLTPSFTAGAAGSLYVLRLTATDVDGGVSTADTEVAVPTTGEILPLAGYPATGVTVTNTGGAASEGAALADASDSTFLLFPAATASVVAHRNRLAPSVPRVSMTWTPKVALDTAGTIVLKARLYEANTLKKEWTLTTPSTSFADQSLALSSAECLTISTAGWSNLYWEQTESTV